MSHNPVLSRLGFSIEDRVAVINADDVGMCQATVPAFFELLDSGLVSSGSVMVPCPWFLEVAAWSRRRAAADLGVHLTLTSEWERYRWRPISTCDPGSGLIDREGFFYRNHSMWDGPDLDAVLGEMRAQLDRACRAGIDITHLDSHMFAILGHGIVEGYVALGFERRLPVLMHRQPAWVKALTAEAIDRWEEQGLPVFDHLREMPLNQPSNGWLGAAKRLFDQLPAGLTYVIVHPALDTPELRAIADDWQQRVADYETFRTAELRDHVKNSGIHVIGWQTLRDLMPQTQARATARPSHG